MGQPHQRTPLKSMIRRADLTQVEIAQRLKISQSALSLMVAGRQPLRVPLIIPLARMLKVPAEEVIVAWQRAQERRRAA